MTRPLIQGWLLVIIQIAIGFYASLVAPYAGFWVLPILFGSILAAGLIIFEGISAHDDTRLELERLRAENRLTPLAAPRASACNDE